MDEHLDRVRGQPGTPTRLANERPSANSADGDALLVLLRLLSTATNNNGTSVDLPVFNGYPHEDPGKYLDVCADRLNRRPKDTWKDSIAPKLQGDAAKWWTESKDFLGSFEEFRRSFLRKFADPLLLQDLHQDLVHRREGAKERTEAFVCRKRLLAKRLMPGATEREIVDLCVGLLRRDMYRHFVDRRPRNTNDLIDVATVYERVDDVRDETPRQRPSAPKCRYCPGYHYHANCPSYKTSAGRETSTG